MNHMGSVFLIGFVNKSKMFALCYEEVAGTSGHTMRYSSLLLLN